MVNSTPADSKASADARLVSGWVEVTATVCEPFQLTHVAVPDP